MGLVYKSVALLGGLLFCSSLFAADTYNHSFNVGWSYSEDSVSGNGRTVYLEPEGLAFSYSYSLNEKVSLSVSYKNPEDDQLLAQSFRLSRDSTSLGASINYLLENDISLSAAYWYQEKETLVWSPINQNRYEELFKVEELELMVLKDWYFDNFAVTPSLAIAYQNSELDFSQNFLFRQSVDGRLIPISSTELEEDKGVYSSVVIDISMFNSFSQHVVLIPNVSVGWIEPVLGDITSSMSARVINQSSSTVSTSHTQDDYGELSGQGMMGAGMLLLFDRYSLNGSYSRVMSGDEKPQSWQISLGIEF